MLLMRMTQQAIYNGNQLNQTSVPLAPPELVPLPPIPQKVVLLGTVIAFEEDVLLGKLSAVSMKLM